MNCVFVRKKRQCAWKKYHSLMNYCFIETVFHFDKREKRLNNIFDTINKMTKWTWVLLSSNNVAYGQWQWPWPNRSLVVISMIPNKQYIQLMRTWCNRWTINVIKTRINEKQKAQNWLQSSEYVRQPSSSSSSSSEVCMFVWLEITLTFPLHYF